MATDLILGTAGHIDHGKTSLIRALTGVDTDRLPEEKQRGITIDLGFAQLRVGAYCLGIVDVPGHERFVRNMLAGATGIDLALLVVAADDSLKPQTREHFDILRLLNLQAGVIAITKCDLADGSWIDLVEDEIREFVRGSFLESAPLVRTSSATGEGLDTLRAELERAARQAAAQRDADGTEAPFRMAIDRAFTLAGHGTIVTGSVSSGQVQVGDELAIEPGALRVRVRGLQNHDQPAQQVHRGQRAAVNLAGVHHAGIERGQELATPGHLQPSRVLTVRLQAVPGVPRPIKNRCRVRVHLGTAELLGTLVLLDADALGPTESAYAQLHLVRPAVATWSQPFVIRSESPVQTIGGGQVLMPDAERLRRGVPETLAQLTALSSPEPLDRAAAAWYFAGLRRWQPADLARTAGIASPQAVYEALCAQGLLCEVAVSPTRTVCFHRDVLQELCDRLEKTLEKLHHQFPLRVAHPRLRVRQLFHYIDDAVFQRAVATLQRAGRIRLSDDGIALEGHGPKLTANERKLLGQLVEDYRQAGFEPPTVAQMQQQASRNQAAVPQLIALAVANGDLVAISAEYYLHADVDRATRAQLASLLADRGGLTVSQIREILNTSRKYAVPYCEYLDRIGFTRREGDVRCLAVPHSSTPDP